MTGQVPDTKSDGIVWEIPPPQMRGKTPEWVLGLERLVEVAKQPGRWARVCRFKSKTGADSARDQLQTFAEMHDHTTLWEPFRSGPIRHQGEQTGEFGVWAQFVDPAAKEK